MSGRNGRQRWFETAKTVRSLISCAGGHQPARQAPGHDGYQVGYKVRNLISPFWRSMLANPTSRCLVPFTQFAESGPNIGQKEVWFNVAAAPVAAFAGIWRPSEAGNIFAFLTCAPNPRVATIHPKAMPVILHPEDYSRWLEGEDSATLAAPFPFQPMAVEEGAKKPLLV